MKHIHHTTDTNDKCNICGQPIKYFWYDVKEMNGKSETTSQYNGKLVHYFCIPGAKSLQEMNEERKRKASS